MGTEIYWHGILDYDNRDNRKLEEVKTIHERVEKIREVTGAKYKAAFGLVRDYDNDWDAEIDIWHKRIISSSEDEIFQASQLTHTPMDYVNLTDETDPEELATYRLLIYPHPLILTEKRAAVLKQYAENGGTLIIGARTGMKDITGKCVMAPMPGLLAGFTGSDVREFTYVGPADEPQSMTWDGEKISTGIFSDILETTLPDAQILANYDMDYYKGCAALIERKVGEGNVLHFGGTFTVENSKAFFRYAGVCSPYERLVELPEECELVVREKEGRTYLFILNYSRQPQKVFLKSGAVDMDTNDVVEGEICLPPYGTKVFRKG